MFASETPSEEPKLVPTIQRILFILQLLLPVFLVITIFFFLLSRLSSGADSLDQYDEKVQQWDASGMG